MRYEKKRKRTRKKLWVGAAGCVLAAGCFCLVIWVQPGAVKKDAAQSGLHTEALETSAKPGLQTEALAEQTKPKESRLQNEQERSEETEQSSEEVKAAFLAQESKRIINLTAGEMALEGMAPDELVSHLFYAAAVDGELLARIQGKSYTPNEHILASDLSYLRMLHYGADGNTYVGEMIVNQEIETEVLEIFQALYENQYPIERMVLIDDYNADDEASMEANNTSAFNYRTIAGSSKLSNHSYGMAIDLNPLYNPYVKTAADGSVFCQPQGGYAYADRTREFAYKIDKEDLAYQLFTQAGFTWGGNWNSVKDYQHFEMEK